MEEISVPHTPATAEQSNPQPMRESVFSTPIKRPPFYKKRIFALLVILILTIGAALGAIYYFKNIPETKITKDTLPLPVKNKPLTIPAPTFSAKQFTYAGTLPAVSSLSTYILKSNFSQSEVSSFAASLKLENVTAPDNNGDIYASSSKASSRGALIFNTKTGAFSYQSYGEFIPPNYRKQTLERETISILETLGLYDPTISCGITYKNKMREGVTFVECHRMWTALNAPLLNLGGTLNIPENTKISSLTPGKVTANDTPTNPDIIDVSNGGNGLERPSQFNTITVGLYPDGSIYSIASTMRHLKQTVAIDPSELITAQEALDYFKQNKGTLTLTVPTGSGSVDWNKIYPKNVASADIAAINEVTPAFLDKPLISSQESYEPYYLIRGTAKLTSGYTVAFTQSIPAQKSKLAANPQSIAEGEDAIQLKTFTLPPSTPITQPPVATPGTSTAPISDLPISTLAPTGPVTYTACQLVKDDAGYTFTLKVPGYGDLSVTTANRGSKNDTYRTYFFATDRVYTASSEFEAIRTAFFKAVEEQYVIKYARVLTDRDTVSGRKNIHPNKLRQDIMTSVQEGIVNPHGGSMKDCTLNDLTKGGYCFQTKTAQGVADKVKARIGAIQNDNALLESTANQENLFPDKSLLSMNWLFEYSPVAGSVGNLPADYVNKNNEKIECYISGSSPHIFIYSKDNKDITVKTGATLTYSDPIAVHNMWAGNVKDTIFTNNQGVSRASIYYEYDPQNVNFTEPNEGYITTSSDISKIVKVIAGKLGLTKIEAQALNSDAQNALADLPQPKYIKVSMINKNEINKELPLEISPKPVSITRIHLMLSAVPKNTTIQAPQIQKIKRSDYSLLELGAYAKK